MMQINLLKVLSLELFVNNRYCEFESDENGNIAVNELLIKDKCYLNWNWRFFWSRY